MSENFYSILGVDENATKDELKNRGFLCYKERE